MVILALVGIGAPLVKPAISRRHVFKITRTAKMTAEETAAALPTRLPLISASDLRRDVRCEEDTRTTHRTRGRTDMWDYICTFVPQPASSAKRLKVGVRVGPKTIRHVSAPYEIDTPYISH